MTEPVDLRALLDGVADGRLSVEDALRMLPLLQISQVEEFARLDIGRGRRKGVPEVVFAPGKSDAQLVAIVTRFLADGGLALVSRLDPDRVPALEAGLEGGPPHRVSFDPEAGILEVIGEGYRPPGQTGTVGVMTAGTSDIPVAEEAAVVLEHMGCRVHRAFDVGVSGVHRLLAPLRDMIEAGMDALIVVAGMEGALPSVIAGLVDVPVVGVPTSTGYGVGGDGVAALYSMLQSCSPGLVVVNIDNGVGAGAAAGLMVRRRS